MAVKEAFCRMYNKGLIYRATRLVNWCCKLNTALSDLEVDHVDLAKPGMLKVPVPGPEGEKMYEFGYITNFVYKVKGEDTTLEVATTRLETMLGDVAVAVHPDDERYQSLIGKELEHPFIADRKVVVIADPILVDMTFGTGAVKVTPAHDPNDFECGNRNKLPQINIFNDNGTINEKGGKYTGMFRFDARIQMEKDMEELGILRGKTPNVMSIGQCVKTGDIIEPLVKPQWYVDCKDMADRSLKAAETKELNIQPEFYNETWKSWLTGIQDWCISRQLWWGHRIPAYLVKIEGHETQANPDGNDQNSFVVGRSEEEALEAAAEKFGVEKSRITLIQDEDVLDTWFSSGLYPFATCHWPEETPDLKDFFPGDILETGHDIIFFWVARMVMMSLCLTDKLPFTTVYLHALVKDKEGKKMSKSLGNVIDPLEVIDGCTLDTLLNKVKTSNLHPSEIKRSIKQTEKEFKDGIPSCGSDALRFSLLCFMSNPRQINLDMSRVLGYRNFCNKIWNAAKFTFMNLSEGFVPEADVNTLKLSVADKWILTSLKDIIELSNAKLEDHDYGSFAQGLYDFWLKNFCDVYLETTKIPLQGTDEDAKKACRNVLYQVLETGLRLFSVVMPYITEELWQRLPVPADQRVESIVISEYPKTFPINEDKESVELFITLDSMLSEVRSVRGKCGIGQKVTPNLFISPSTPEIGAFLKDHSEYFQKLSSTGEVALVEGDAPAGCLKAHCAGTDLYLQVAGLIDTTQEIERINKEIGKQEKLIANYEKKISNPKIPEEAKAENQEKLTNCQAQISTLKESLEQLA